MRPIVALLTDFGTRDAYVAQVKGILMWQCDATLVDLTHEIAEFDVAEAAFFLNAAVGAFRHLPERVTIIVAVVDPGVGSSRRILAAHDKGLFFLAPDNGLLSVVLSEHADVRELTNEKIFLSSGTSTFHGRDRFAPAAAALANGASLDELGPPVPRDSIISLGYESPRYGPEVSSGTVISIDRFGNLVTDLDPAKISNADTCIAEIRGQRIHLHAPHYSAMSGSGEPFFIKGSRGTLEISISNGDAAGTLGVQRFDRVTIRGNEEMKK